MIHDFGEFEIPSVDEVYAEGLDFLESHHFDEALHAFEYVVEQQPYNSDAIFHKAFSLLNLRRFDEAANVYQGAIEMSPGESLYHGHCGYALMMSGKYPAALRHFDNALRLNPAFYQNKVYKACIVAEQGNLASARELLAQVLAEHPDDADARRNYAKVLAATGEIGEALATFARVLKAQPNCIEAIHSRATLFLRQGATDAALRCMAEMTALAPESLDHWRELLAALVSAGRWQAVIAAANGANEAGHDNAAINLWRGMALIEQCDFDRAVANLARAKEQCPDSSEIKHHLARAQAGAQTGPNS